MTDEFRPSADNQPIVESEQPPELIPGGETAVYEVETPDTETNIEAAHPVEERESLTLQGWLRAIFGSQESSETRIADLSQMIETYPDVPANYVFRGELLLKAGAYERAADDFRQALELAEQQVETSNWGFVAQTLQDRALAGLEKAERRLKIPTVRDEP